MKSILLIIFSSMLIVFPINSIAGDQPVYSLYVSAAGTNITTAAYLQLDAAMDASCSQLDIFNSTASALYLAIGGAGAEINIPYNIGPGAGFSYRVHVPIMKGVRLSARALTANATTGFLIVNCLQ